MKSGFTAHRDNGYGVLVLTISPLSAFIFEVFQDILLFTKSIHEELAEEIIRVSYSIYVRRNASRLIKFKPEAENEKVNLVYLNRNDENDLENNIRR